MENLGLFKKYTSDAKNHGDVEGTDIQLYSRRFICRDWRPSYKVKQEVPE